MTTRPHPHLRLVDRGPATLDTTAIIRTMERERERRRLEVALRELDARLDGLDFGDPTRSPLARERGVILSRIDLLRRRR